MTRPLDAFAAALTFGLCVVWGFNQVIAKVALADVGPIAQTGVRSAIGVVCVLAYALAAKRRVFKIDGSEAAGALAGVLFTAEFIVLYESLRFTTAARATVFIYAAPLFVALGAALVLRSERLKPLQWLGLLLAFLGVALGMMGRSAGGGAFGDALALLAAALWAATTILIRATSLRRADPVKVLLYQIAAAALIAPLAASALGEPAPTHVSATTAAVLLWQGVAGGGELRDVVLAAHQLRGGAALGLHFCDAAGRRLRRLARVRRAGDGRLRGGHRAGARRARAGQLAAQGAGLRAKSWPPRRPG